jgi:hypothetical protein
VINYFVATTEQGHSPFWVFPTYFAVCQYFVLMGKRKCVCFSSFSEITIILIYSSFILGQENANGYDKGRQYKEWVQHTKILCNLKRFDGGIKQCERVCLWIIKCFIELTFIKTTLTMSVNLLDIHSSSWKIWYRPLVPLGSPPSKTSCGDMGQLPKCRIIRKPV